MSTTGTTKKTWWTVLIFYFLIAFEVFFMVSPFALYYYSVYAKGLNFLNDSPPMQWLSSFFMPHIVVETASFWLDKSALIGGILAGISFCFFLIGVGQIYYDKLTLNSSTMFFLPPGIPLNSR